MANKLTSGIVYMIAKDRQPLSIVEDKGFRGLMKVAVPLYTIPSRQTITSRVDDQYQVLQNRVKTILSNVDSISLTSDIWTDPYNTKGFIGVTAHYIDTAKMKLRSIDLGMRELDQKHESAYISTILRSICQDWGIKDTSIQAVITDHAANMKKAVHDTYGGGKHLPCFAHTLNLMIQDALAAVPNLDHVVQKVKSIVTFFQTKRQRH